MVAFTCWMYGWWSDTDARGRSLEELRHTETSAPLIFIHADKMLHHQHHLLGSLFQGVNRNSCHFCYPGIRGPPLQKKLLVSRKTRIAMTFSPKEQRVLFFVIHFNHHTSLPQVRKSSQPVKKESLQGYWVVSRGAKMTDDTFVTELYKYSHLAALCV